MKCNLHRIINLRNFVCVQEFIASDDNSVLVRPATRIHSRNARFCCIISELRSINILRNAVLKLHPVGKTEEVIFLRFPL